MFLAGIWRNRVSISVCIYVEYCFWRVRVGDYTISVLTLEGVGDIRIFLKIIL
jgi:hypothetical protein